VATEAKARNPDILIYGLVWDFPGWVVRPRTLGTFVDLRQVTFRRRSASGRPAVARGGTLRVAARIDPIYALQSLKAAGTPARSLLA
jgi:hypothetical protein